MASTINAQRFRHLFDWETRQRGSRDFQHGAVSLDACSDKAITGRVAGSHEQPYPVNIDLSTLAENNTVAFRCGCRRFQERQPCQHVWALLLEFDERLNDGPRGSGNDHAAERGPAPTRGRQFTAEHPDGWLAEGAEEVVRGRSPSAGTVATKSFTKQPENGWQQQLGLLGRGANRPAHVPSPQAAEFAGLTRKRIWYVIDVSESLRACRVKIQLFTHERKKNGEFGKLRIAKLRRGEVDGLSDPDDRAVLPYLFDKLVDFETQYGYYRNDWQTLSRCLLNPGSSELLLPKIAATGRLAWLLDASLPAEEAQRVAWDAGEPWQFRPVIQADEAAQAWHVRGELFRGDATRGLEDAVLIVENDVVLFAESVARCDLQEGAPWLKAIREHAAISIPYADRQLFLASLASWPQPSGLQLPPNLCAEQHLAAPRGRVLIQKPHSRNEPDLYADVSFMYGGHVADQSENGKFEVKLASNRPAWYDAQHDRFVIRDRQAESALLEQLFATGVRGIHPTTYRLADVSFERRKFADIVQRLVAANWLVESEGNPIRAAGAFSLSVKTDIDWFELNGSIDFDGVTATLPSLLAAIQAGQSLIQLDDGSTGMLPEAWLKKFGSLATLAESKGDALRFAPSQALLLDVLLAEQEQVTLDAGFVRVRDKLRGFSGVNARNEPRGFKGELREYQRVGLGWMQFLRDFHFGGCLADDMGLGKTIQVLAMLQTRRLGKKSGRRPSLVVVPKSLVFNWLDEAEKFTPRLRVLNYTGLDRRERLESLPACDLVVTTYGTLRRDILDLKEIEFDYAILDESQAIKNHHSQAAKACRLLKSRYRLAMTGTPIENHLGELWSLFEFLNPGMLGRTTSFASLAKSAASGADDTVEALARAIQPFVLRRTKQQVLTELPEKTEQTLYCELSPTQRREYNEIRDFYRQQLAGKVAQDGLAKSKIHVLEALLRLRQAACHPGLIDKQKRTQGSAKVDALLEQLDEILAEGHKALVFSQFTSLLAIVRQQLDRKKVTYEYLDGKTRKREEKVKRFQEDPDCSLFLISLKAGGSGLNLTAADYVFILDPWWNPAVEAQAIDRTHRIGQTRRVFAYRLIAQDTVEEKILELQKSKRQLADALIAADDSVIRNLTTEDLQLLLS